MDVPTESPLQWIMDPMLHPRNYDPPATDNSIRQDVPVATLTSAVSRDSEDATDKVLLKLGHLNLTGHVVSDCPVMKAHGGYCDIFIGSLSPSFLSSYSGKIKVAIKRLRVCLHSDRALAKLFVKEIYIWSGLDHPNVLPFKGYMMENGYPSLISEWVENGTVMGFLKVNPRADIEAMLLGIAKGLGYLHNKNIVHSDLKADNVLISQLGFPLICDFGISSMIISSHSFPLSTTHSGSLRGSTRWMSIELFGIDSDIDPKHTKASDIWAYGMTIYEILTKQRPYAHLKADQRVILAIIRGELPSRPDYNEQLPAIGDIWGICEDCWKTDPGDRITISEIILRMEQCSSPIHSEEGYSNYSSAFSGTIASSSNMHRDLSIGAGDAGTSIESAIRPGPLFGGVSNAGASNGMKIAASPAALELRMAITSPRATPSQSRDLLPSSSNTVAPGSATVSRANFKDPAALAEASTTLSRPLVFLPLSKPFKCPKPGCVKSYTRVNGLKYHVGYGQCYSIPPSELSSVERLSKREAERRLRYPFFCQVPLCRRRYRTINGLQCHYQFRQSSDHDARGLSLLAHEQSQSAQTL